LSVLPCAITFGTSLPKASPKKAVELRQHKRYRLAALVSFEWESNGGTFHRGDGYTRDISPAGVFVVTSQPLPVGIALRLEVDLPSLQTEGSGPRLRTNAHVIRAERGGFAAIADTEFRLQLQGSENGRRVLNETAGEQALGATLARELVKSRCK